MLTHSLTMHVLIHLFPSSLLLITFLYLLTHGYRPLVQIRSQDVMSLKSKKKSVNKVKKNVLPDVVPATGNRSPFRNSLALLHKAAQNRLRLFIQLVNAFPNPDERDTCVINCLKDLLEAVKTYRTIWTGMAVDHKMLMVTFVRIVHNIFVFSCSLCGDKHSTVSPLLPIIA